MLPSLLFPESVDPRRVDPAFAAEQEAARALGFETGLVDGALLSRPVPPGPALYRGWMMTPTEYEALYAGLGARGVTLLTNPAAYRVAHYLPETYRYLAPQTPESLWFPARAIAKERPRIEEQLAATFGSAALVIKDYVKSEKGYWHEAMFIPDSSDVRALWRVVDRFLELRGPHLNEGVVFRRFVELPRLLSNDPRALEPCKLEVRIFWLDGRPLFTQPEGPGAYYGEKRFQGIAASIPARFFTMDVALARYPTGDHWTVIECGDGQVSSFAAGEERVFYERVRLAFTDLPPHDE